MKVFELDFDTGITREAPQYYTQMQVPLDIILNCADPHTYLQVIKFKKQSIHSEPPLGGEELPLLFLFSKPDFANEVQSCKAAEKYRENQWEDGRQELERRNKKKSKNMAAYEKET